MLLPRCWISGVTSRVPIMWSGQLEIEVIGCCLLRSVEEIFGANLGRTDAKLYLHCRVRYASTSLIEIIFMNDVCCWNPSAKPHGFHVVGHVIQSLMRSFRSRLGIHRKRVHGKIKCRLHDRISPRQSVVARPISSICISFGVATIVLHSTARSYLLILSSR